MTAGWSKQPTSLMPTLRGWKQSSNNWKQETAETPILLDIALQEICFYNFKTVS